MRDELQQVCRQRLDAISNLQALSFRGVQASYGLREAGCVFCALHRRCISREQGAQPGDPASSWGRRAVAAPAGVERRGGAGSFDTEVLRSAGGNLMPSDNKVGLNLKHAIIRVRVTALVDQLQG
jgi:hypothetical protein